MSERFPGFRVLDQAGHWDDATRAVVMERVGRPSDIRFFDAHEEGTATALFDLLLDQDPENRLVPVTAMVDARLAEKQTDGWHYDSMATDPEAWRTSLAALDVDAQELYGTEFAACAAADRRALLESVRSGDGEWRGFDRERIWSLWTRYACTAFYSHPAAWDEIGFAGPAYPRGYKNIGIGKREPFEVADAHPDEIPQTRAQR
ncbi:gluconate 2-dehydrogenase subunit 3 family protein [Leifsonia sp. AG29]|uniref:gluconate 2-dehydrogenase subunit 3 family protein n=1 Tax=Leifsonia sp. AG29 TaxID=2598860 RepID=UPI001E60979C|nr:gluconate 2-dehydrogenase subunit 3 family protein [Leifsonia sp. AG29]